MEKLTSLRHIVCGVEFTVTNVPGVDGDEKFITIVTMKNMLRVEQTISLQLALHGIVTGESFRYMRKTVGMRAADLANLLNVRAETVSDWETGKSPVNRAAWGWLASLVAEKAKECSLALKPMISAANHSKLGHPKKITIAMLPMKDTTVDVPL